MNRKHKMDIAHDRFVTAKCALEEAVKALTELAEHGHVDPELHEEVYDLHADTRRVRRVLDKARRWPNGITVWHKERIEREEYDHLDELVDILDDADHFTVEYRFVVQGDDISLDRPMNIFYLKDLHAKQASDLETKRIRRVSGFLQLLREKARESLSETYFEADDTMSISEMRKRLEEAFRRLRDEDDILAKSNYSCCASCATSELHTEIQESDERWIGAAYWHSQDEDKFADGEDLMIGYGSNPDLDDAPDTQVIGEMVVSRLEEQDLTVEWDGSSATRVRVKAG